MQQDHITLARIGRRAMRLATLAYAIYLLVGALVVMVSAISIQAWLGIAEGLFLLFCAAVFFWGQRQTQEPLGSSSRGTRTSTARGWKLAWSLRQWSLLMTGAGAGIAVAMYPFAMIARHYGAGVPIIPAVVFAYALPLAGAGVIVFFVDVIDRRSERRHRGAPS